MRPRVHALWLELTVTLALVAAAAGGCAGAAPLRANEPAATSPNAIRTTTATALTTADVGRLSAAFVDNPFQGGQTPPFLATWVSPSSFIFLQFDRPSTSATALAYLGVGTKGTFCAETRPDAAGGSFTRFQRYQAKSWQSGAGGPPGEQGYWLTFLAVDGLQTGGRTVGMGVDYHYPAPAPPRCGSSPAPSFEPAGAGRPARDWIATIFNLFTEHPLSGGQVPPRVFKSVHDGVLAFFEFDRNSATDATELHWIGIFKRAPYCRSSQPTQDFVHFHRVVAANYATGHGGDPGVDGFWGAWLTAEPFDSQGRTLQPGIDRDHNPTPPPSSC